MENSSLKIKVEKYLNDFKNKNIESLSVSFDEEITLEDWEISAVGKKSVIEANKKIFNSFESIDIEIINLISEDHTVVAELVLNFNNHEKIKVIDVIKFTNLGKIKSINAYKG